MADYTIEVTWNGSSLAVSETKEQVVPGSTVAWEIASVQWPLTAPDWIGVYFVAEKLSDDDDWQAYDQPQPSEDNVWNDPNITGAKFEYVVSGGVPGGKGVQILDPKIINIG